MSIIRSIVICVLVLYSMVSQGQTIDTVLLRQKGVKYQVQYTNGSTYQWFVDGGTIVSGNGTNEIMVDWGKLPGDYDVWVLERNSFGCPGDTIFQKIHIQPHEFPVIVGKNKICPGEITELTVTGEDSSYTNITYIWSTGEVSKSIFVSPFQTTTYTVRVDYNGDVIDSASYVVEVISGPHGGITWTPQFPKINEEIIFSFVGKASSPIYQWYFNGERNPFFMPQIARTIDSAGYVNVRLIVYNELGCMDTIDQKIYIKSQTPFLIPDAFSPNRDGRNDEFVINIPQEYSKINCRIFNRWGTQLYASADHSIRWDGFYNGTLIGDGAYVVTIEAVDETGKWVKFDGTVSVLR